MGGVGAEAATRLHRVQGLALLRACEPRRLRRSSSPESSLLAPRRGLRWATHRVARTRRHTVSRPDRRLAESRSHDSGCRDIVPYTQIEPTKQRAALRIDGQIWGNDISDKEVAAWGNEMRNIVPPPKMRIVNIRNCERKVEAPGVEPGSESVPPQYLRAYPMI